MATDLIHQFALVVDSWSGGGLDRDGDNASARCLAGVFYGLGLKDDWGEAVFGFAQDQAVLLPDAIGEKDTVEVVDFVLNISGLDSGEIFGDGFKGTLLLVLEGN